MRLKMTIAYDGTMYSGWQIQPSAVTIQETIERALAVILPEPARIWGSGRTDAGVHAQGQVAHFILKHEIDLERFQRSMNGLLPPDIRILEVEVVPDQFHSQFSAKGKIYHYHISLGQCHIPFLRNYSALVRPPFDLDRLQKAIPHFVGTHDFTTFANSANQGCAAKNPVRTIYRIDMVPEEHGVRLEFEGSGFLYKMVRNITKALMDVATGKLESEMIPELFAAKNRRKIGAAAPARGLFLMKVIYDEED